MLKWNKVVFDMCMGEEAEDRIRKVAIVSAVVGFSSTLGCGPSTVRGGYR